MFLLLSLLLILFFPLSYASENFADFKKEWYLVNVPVAKVYESPDNASGYTEKTLYGHFVEKLKIENTEADFFLEWVKIKKENQATGFMMRQELTSDNILWRTDVNLKRICILCASIFTFPSFHNSKVIMKLPYNAYVNSDKLSDDHIFTEVTLLDKTKGWIKTENLEPVKPLSLTDIIERVEIFNGLRCGQDDTDDSASAELYYLDDSSIFMQTIAAQMGYQKMKGHVSEQTNDNELIPVNFQDIQPGDFLYFGAGDTITNAGFCTKKNTIMCHVLESHQNRIMKITIDCMISYFKCARRLPELKS